MERGTYSSYDSEYICLEPNNIRCMTTAYSMGTERDTVLLCFNHLAISSIDSNVLVAF
jgi:hypothetical protein